MSPMPDPYGGERYSAALGIAVPGQAGLWI